MATLVYWRFFEFGFDCTPKTIPSDKNSELISDKVFQYCTPKTIPSDKNSELISDKVFQYIPSQI